MKQALKHNSDNEQAQHLILKIRLAVTTGRLEMLPDLNSKIKAIINNNYVCKRKQKIKKS